ncbi:hypothetical protein PDIDSM_408 [Penicillium digitatum]|nr:hypothetical protein PDIDSM_408 [Penicillium digitatum]
MNTGEPRYDYLSCELLQPTAGFFLQVTSLASLSLLGLIFVRGYIKHRRWRKTHIIPSSEFKQQKQDLWLQSIMEKRTIISPASHSPSACEILQPLSHSCLLPSSGALAAQAREQQSKRLASTASNPTSLEASSPDASEVQKCNESIQQMSDEHADGVRTWKRVVVEYR